MEGKLDHSIRSCLLQIAHEITEDKLEQLKYLCCDDIPERELEKIKSPLQLFKDLERRQLIKTDDLSFLRRLLADATCPLLVSKVDDFTTSQEVKMLFLKMQRRQTDCLKQQLKQDCVNHPDYREISCGCSVTDGKADDDMTEFHTTGKCSCAIHYSRSDQRKPGEIDLRVALELATKGAWIAGTAFILKRYINDPKNLMRLFASVVLPSGILVKYLCEGSVICVLEANDLQGLKELWLRYENGTLQKALEDVFITEELRNLAAGQEIILNVDIDENVYRNVCLELIVTKGKVDQILSGIEQRPRSLSDPVTSQLKKPEKSLQQESLHIVANTERKRRLDAERKLQQLTAGQSLELRFPELQEFIDKNYDVDTAAEGASESDDNSSTTSTLDEEEVLDWEDENNSSKEFWSSVKGGLKEKKWTHFKEAVKEAFPDDIKHGGTPLLKFLAYILTGNYAIRSSENISLHNFIRLTRWFGPFTQGPQGCLQKMSHLMKNSASIDSDGKSVSWFAGYMTEQQAKDKLRNEKGGAFLVRFNTSAGFLLSKKSRDANSVVDFPIEVHKDTGHVSFGDRVFDDLPSLVKELQKSWMTDLRPFYSTGGTGTDSPAAKDF